MHYMHYKDYIHHDFLQQQSAWLLRKPPLPCHRGEGGTIWLGGEGGVGVPAHIWLMMVNNDLLGGALPILKNNGVKVNGVGMTSLFYEMEKKNK